MSRLMIIPAAGTGSRLGTTTPKVLFAVNGRPMIDHLLDLYAPVVDRFVLVLHPSFEDAVRRHCAGRPEAIEYDAQREPTGMLDAIRAPRERGRRHAPASVWITWCDQVAVHPRTVARLAVLSSEDPPAPLIFPTVRRAAPYSHLVRDDGGRIVAIQHRREGDPMPDVGESEMGLFCLSLETYLVALDEFACEAETGAATRERNFLPFIPWLARRADVRTFPGQDALESVGINTLDELRQIEAYLLARQ